MKKIIYSLVLILCLNVVGCDNSSKNDDSILSNDALFTEFKFEADKNSDYLESDIIGIIQNANITVVVPCDKKISKLIATFSIKGKVVYVNHKEQISGETENDYSQSLDYNIVAENGSESKYTIIVKNLEPKATNQILKFKFEKSKNTAFLEEDIEGVIEDNKIVLTCPYKTKKETLIATFETTGHNVEVLNIKQESGSTGNDFSKPVRYLVTAEDGTVNEYFVKIKHKLKFVEKITQKNTAVGELHSYIIRKLFVDENDIMYVLTENKLATSNDNGETWQNIDLLKILNLKPANYWINDIYVDKNGIYLATNYGLIISYDKGKNWTIYNRSNGLFQDRIYRVNVSNGRIYAFSYSYFSISTPKNLDGKITWRNYDFRDQLGLGPRMYNLHVTVHNQKIYLAIDSEFFVLEDLTNNLLLKRKVFINDSINNISVINNKVIMSSWFYIMISDNDGETWDYCSFLNPKSDVYNFIVENYQDKTIYRDSNISVLNAWNKSFEHVSQRLHDVSISENKIFVSTSNGFYVSEDNCKTWKKYQNNDLLINNYYENNTVSKLIEQFNNKIYLSYQYQNYVGFAISDDSGLSWRNKFPEKGLCDNEIIRIFNKNNLLIAISESGVSYKEHQSDWIRAIENSRLAIRYVKDAYLSEDNKLYILSYNKYDATASIIQVFNINTKKIENEYIFNENDMGLGKKIYVTNEEIYLSTTSGFYVSALNIIDWKYLNKNYSCDEIIVKGDNITQNYNDGGFYISVDKGLNWEYKDGNVFSFEKDDYFSYITNNYFYTWDNENKDWLNTLINSDGLSFFKDYEKFYSTNNNLFRSYNSIFVSKFYYSHDNSYSYNEFLIESFTVDDYKNDGKKAVEITSFCEDNKYLYVSTNKGIYVYEWQ